MRPVQTLQLYRQNFQRAEPSLWRDVLEICSWGWLGLWVCAILREVLR